MYFELHFFHARFHNSQILGTSNLLLSRLKLSFRLAFWRGTWADHNFEAFWGWRLLWDLTTMDAWKTSESGDLQESPCQPRQKEGMLKFGGNVYQRFAQFLLITLWFLSRVLCCGIKITSPYSTQHEKFIPNRKDIHHSGCTLSSSTSLWINF